MARDGRVGEAANGRSSRTGSTSSRQPAMARLRRPDFNYSRAGEDANPRAWHRHDVEKGGLPIAEQSFDAHDAFASGRGALRISAIAGHRDGRDDAGLGKMKVVERIASRNSSCHCGRSTCMQSPLNCDHSFLGRPDNEWFVGVELMFICQQFVVRESSMKKTGLARPTFRGIDRTVSHPTLRRMRRPEQNHECRASRRRSDRERRASARMREVRRPARAVDRSARGRRSSGLSGFALRRLRLRRVAGTAVMSGRAARVSA